MKNSSSTLLAMSLALVAGGSQAGECTPGNAATLPRASLAVPTFAVYNPWSDLNGITVMLDNQLNALSNYLRPGVFAQPSLVPMRVSTLQQTRDGYRLEVPLPGFKAEDIHVHLEGQWLRIDAANAETVKVGGQPEQSRSSFAESLTLPGPVDAAGLRQSFKDGVLTLTIPASGKSADKS
jgi:HSP20 family molecular chaperone IbpA